MNDPFDAAAYAQIYRDMLLKDVIPFWMEHSPDREHGGYYFFLGRDGSVYRTDKPVILTARLVWLFSRLYNRIEPRVEWLEMARSGCEFLNRHAFDDAGGMFFLLAEDGQPVERGNGRKPKLATIVGLSEYAVASGDEGLFERIRDLFRTSIDELDAENRLPSKTDGSFDARSFDALTTVLGLSRHMRELSDDPVYEELVERSHNALLRELAVMEEKALWGRPFLQKDKNGRADGRAVLPGGVADKAIGLMREGRRQQQPSLVRTGAQAMDFALALGWDVPDGGLLQFIDAETGQPVGPEGGDKHWWAHCEALYAALLAYWLTGHERYLAWFQCVHDWTFAHFPDPQFGEWFASFSREGVLLHENKGYLWKGPFHLARALMRCWKLLEEMAKTTALPPRHGASLPPLA